MHDHEVVSAAARQRLVAIIRADSAVAASRVGDALMTAGVTVLEVSLTTPDALAAIEDLAARRPLGTQVGAGTVLSPQQVSNAADAGASFIVAPITDREVVGRAHRLGLASIPAASTPNEMVQAWNAGAHLIKVFPASTWTPTALRDVLVALPDLRLVPTGGISVSAAPEWVRAGATAVGLGGSLTAGSPAMVTKQATAALVSLGAAGGPGHTDMHRAGVPDGESGSYASQ